MASAIGEEALELMRQYQRQLAAHLKQIEAMVAAMTGTQKPSQPQN